MTVSKLLFVAPEPGFWSLDVSHYCRPLTLFYEQNFPAALAEGWHSACLLYGVPLAQLDCRVVNGCPYVHRRPAFPRLNPSTALPWRTFAELAEQFPDMQQRARSSERVFATKRWREDLKTWETVARPTCIRIHHELLAVDPAGLSDEALVVYLEHLRDNFRFMVREHHLHNMTTYIPTGDYLSHVAQWTGLPMHRLLGPLQGNTPISAGSVPERAVLAAALRRHPEGLKLLSGDAPPADVIAQLGLLGEDVGTHLRSYIAYAGYRPVSGRDILDVNAIEMPELLVHGIRQSLEPDKDDLLAAQQQTSLVRDAVPAANRDCFDELLAEARLVHSLRDERDLYTDSWAAGVARRGFLVAGQRVAAAGRIAAAEDLLNASVDEMRQLLFGEAGAPSGDALHARGLQRQEIDLPAAPPSLGEPPAPRLAGFFPTDMERVARALDAVLGAMFATPPPQTETRMVRGVGASGGIYEGIARKVKDASDLERVRQGDIVIAEMTSASFNMVLPLLGAVVTSRGGVLSHAAIMSREFGIPAVVGTTDAMLVIPEGVRVRVNGNTGEVAVLA